MATCSSILARKITWQSLAGYSPWSPKELDTTERQHSSIWMKCLAPTQETFIPFLPFLVFEAASPKARDWENSPLTWEWTEEAWRRWRLTGWASHSEWRMCSMWYTQMVLVMQESDAARRWGPLPLPEGSCTLAFPGFSCPPKWVTTVHTPV